ncbi:MAG: carbon-nitrogen hydrolase family protein [Candidatus Bathyarchaeota archaeon]|jgi:predicted amidohydrolase|nr:carbon-nitrogen hydrolase family protein [Candidatus Bathyarchaeota archaeon A05DMB-3]MDH7607528.1 carbon-nitrogen hydrolase family protein [Candidatus Bathyarchaeota archaeon]
MRVSLIHMKTRGSVSEALSAACKKISEAAEQKPNFIALPEYFSVPGFIEEFSSAEEIFQKTYNPTFEFLRKVSKQFPNIYIVGGTLVEKSQNTFFNTCLIWKNAKLLGSYRKRNPISIEVKIGISKGDKPFVFPTESGNIGSLICADIFNPEAVKQTVSLGAETIFLPVASLSTHPNVKGHPLSEKIASENGVFIVKVGNVRSDAKGGRSAIIAPWGIIEEAEETFSDKVITADLDIQRLRRYREEINKGFSTPQ